MHLERCFCLQIPKLDLQTKLTLVIHSRELARTTNTGVLATRALKNSEIIVRGKVGEQLDFQRLILPNYSNLLLYPSPTAIELSADYVNGISRPIHLIVPDGNWRQASKVHYRYKELSEIPRVMIKAPSVTSPRLRPETTEDGMATLQAIAYALGAIEGESVGHQLMSLYDLKHRLTLEGRGVRPQSASKP